MRGSGNGACVGHRRGADRMLGGGDSLRGKERLKYLDVDGKILLNLILKKSDGSASTGLILLRTETTDGLL